MSVNETLDRMLKGHSWISICRLMESRGMTRQQINDTMDEAKRMKACIDWK